MSINIKYNTNGTSEISVDEVCAIWKDNFCIELLVKDYLLVLRNAKNRRTCITISEEKAIEIIDKLALIKVEAVMLRNCYNYYTKGFIAFEIKQLEAIIETFGNDDEGVNELLSFYKKALEDNHQLTTKPLRNKL